MRDEGKVFMQYVLSSKLLRSASLTSEERRSELAAAVKAMREDAGLFLSGFDGIVWTTLG